ncbi:MAG: ABC transporter substrate-binding protein [Chitinophagaceae bacterium]|nr:ABC transporter substrate-binding protein [Chitinophagaceae bacterium]
MKKLFFPVLFFLAAVFSLQMATAQQADSFPKLKTYRVGIFAPLYLDSVFSAAGNFRYTQGMPKFITPAVDFINGIQIGLDSLKLDNANIEAYIYDTKSYTTPLQNLIKSKKLDSLDLILGPVRDQEYRQLADFALAKNIPFISAAYPNDGGISSNPFVVILNSTLRAHCEAIYSYILQSHGTDKIYLCRKKGQQEERVAGYFKSMNNQDGKPLLSIQTINFDSTISAELLKKKLDSNRQSIIIGGSLDESFASGLAYACNDLYQQYPITLIGMPNWDAFKSLSKKDEFEEFPIYFTTPYYNSKSDGYSRMLIDGYKKKLKGNPSDMAFKGFECAQLFIKLISRYPNDFMSHINDKSQKIFTEYNFKPVSIKGTSTIPDYFENKHLYFMRILNGNTYKAW